MKLRISWIKHLTDSRSHKIPKQAFRMFRFHSVPFSTLLSNIFNVLEPHQAKFTFPITASIAVTDIELTRTIVRRGHEVAVHGFKHIKYAHITESQQAKDIKSAVDTFKEKKISVNASNYIRMSLIT